MQRGPEARVVQGAQVRGGRQVRGGAQVRGPQALGAVVVGLAVPVEVLGVLGGLEGRGARRGDSGQGAAGQLQAAVGVARWLPREAQAHTVQARGLRGVAILPALLLDLHVALGRLSRAQEAGQTQAVAGGHLATRGLWARSRWGLPGRGAALLHARIGRAPGQEVPGVRHLLSCRRTVFSLPKPPACPPPTPLQ